MVTNYFGTCLTNANGKILRVALDGAIPADNPLVGETEVTACGASAAPRPPPLAHHARRSGPGVSGIHGVSGPIR